MLSEKDGSWQRAAAARPEMCTYRDYNPNPKQERWVPRPQPKFWELNGTKGKPFIRSVWGKPSAFRSRDAGRMVEEYESMRSEYDLARWGYDIVPSRERRFDAYVAEQAAEALRVEQAEEAALAELATEAGQRFNSGDYSEGLFV